MGIYDRIHCYLVRGELDKAAADVEAAERMPLAPIQKGSLLIWKARLKLKVADLNSARDLCDQAMNYYPTLPMELTTRGLVASRAGTNVEALQVLTQAIELERYCAEAYWFRHQVYEAMGEHEKAEADRAVAEGYAYKPYM